jgi:dUTP pyrophosphatase
MERYVNTRLSRNMTSNSDNMVELSHHPDLTLDILKMYPDKAWGFQTLHMHPNFSFEWVNEFTMKFWDWNVLSVKATIDDLAKYPDLFWNWSLITDRIHYKDIMAHPDLPWDFSLFFIKNIRDEHIPFLKMFKDRIPDWKWSRFAKCTNWSTFKKHMDLPWFWFANDVNITTEEFQPEDVLIIRELGVMFNWIKLTMNVHIDIINANPDLDWVPEFLQWNRTTWKTPMQPIETCIREWVAANVIKRQWRKAISDPNYKMCRRRLRREFKELVQEESRMSVNFNKLRPDAIIPSKATPGSIGLDLHSVDPYIVLPGQRVVVSTGLRVQLPKDVYGRIAPRSGLAVKHGLDVGAGVIDPDYTGEIRVVLFNHDSHNPFIIRPGYRIAQLILERAVDPIDVQEVDSIDDDTSRGSNGFGSTGNV